ncbi:hypothetical protein G4G28_10865 [Massilia sp. Dwa41.01b]|uniref:hypothetical protein n=1 Tax=unclassified Massilia TaxID=2609279 RepID=UPI0016049668|nr:MULTISPECIES: hypothetical protein [unclassified Massilia]QNA88858.1 hypothetical protein G4G28_10865 [Massilia sp. Dwa41.01b]QNA99750.1 hypothetical protein G4G31_14505 [Massilia sp. Se16.2.3]
MLKRLFAFAATALLSLNASASYVQWNVSSPELYGYIVQNEEDLSIAYFDLTVGNANESVHNFSPNGYSDIERVSARYNNRGPSLFEIGDEDTEGLSYHIWFNFSGTNSPDTFRFISYYSFKQV